MTNKDFLLQMIEQQTGISINIVSEIFSIINEYDWKVFCSQMGDYDHPEERVQAKKVIDEKLSHYNESEWKKVWYCLNDDKKISDFYHRKFHSMNDDESQVSSSVLM